MTEKLYVCLPKKHFLVEKESVTFNELDGQSFLLANDLGFWGEVVRRKLPNSNFFKIDNESISELSKHSSIPSFVTNISMNINCREGKVIIPIEDEEANVPFYVLYKEKNKNLFEAIKNNNNQI